MEGSLSPTCARMCMAKSTVQSNEHGVPFPEPFLVSFKMFCVSFVLYITVLLFNHVKNPANPLVTAGPQKEPPSLCHSQSQATVCARESLTESRVERM